jgi:HK97 family phage prohead protease
MDTKTFEALDLSVKSADGTKGEFTALVSVFGNVDLVGDRVMPGAFTKSIEDWQGKSESVPVIFSHEHDNPMAYIGEVDPQNLTQTGRGLFVKGQLDLTNPYAEQTFKLMQKGAVKGFSFGYTVPKESKGSDGARELHEIALFEVGPTFQGANPEAGLLAVKSAADALLEDKPEPSSTFPNRRRAERLYLESLFDL